MPLFNLFFLGLSWPWVGEFDGFIVILICFPTQHNLVNRKHRIVITAVTHAGRWEEVPAWSGQGKSRAVYSVPKTWGEVVKRWYDEPHDDADDCICAHLWQMICVIQMIYSHYNTVHDLDLPGRADRSRSCMIELIVPGGTCKHCMISSAWFLGWICTVIFRSRTSPHNGRRGNGLSRSCMQILHHLSQRRATN